MAGEQGRKLRPRVASSSSSSLVHRRETEEASKKTRLASKRPANNENNVSGFPEPARKRAALSNLTNNVFSRNALQASKTNVSLLPSHFLKIVFLWIYLCLVDGYIIEVCFSRPKFSARFVSTFPKIDAIDPTNLDQHRYIYDSLHSFIT